MASRFQHFHSAITTGPGPGVDDHASPPPSNTVVASETRIADVEWYNQALTA
jgi:hypothetical protein